MPLVDGLLLMARHYLGGTSPLPSALDVIILNEVGQTALASAQLANLVDKDAGATLIYNLYNTYGWTLFRDVLTDLSNYAGTNGKFNFGGNEGCPTATSLGYAEPLRSAILVWFFSASAGISLLNQFNAAIAQVSTPLGQSIPASAYDQARTMFPNVIGGAPAVALPSINSAVIVGVAAAAVGLFYGALTI